MTFPRPEHRACPDPQRPDLCIYTAKDSTSFCGLPLRFHRLREPRSDDRRGRPDGHSLPRRRVDLRRGRPSAPRAPGPSKNEETIVAIDGEGQGRSPHKYTYLAAVDETGLTRGEIRNSAGLGTKEVFDWLLDLGVSRVFGFAISYDLTKILSDLSPRAIYLLNRPDLRNLRLKGGRKMQKPVDWRGYRIGYLRGQLTLRRCRFDPKKRRSEAYGPSVTVWDVFRFFSCKFTTALMDWKVAPRDKLERMMRMKDQRSTFDKLAQKDIEEYCLEECHYLGMLVRKLLDSHEVIGLKLKNFFGAGSTASALLTRFNATAYLKPLPPAEMRGPIAQAFFGGRFECSHVGPIAGKIYNYDISSAYPYHITFLPCLACGRWEHVTSPRELHGAIERSRLALVHAKILRSKGAPEAWAPFPFRTKDGSIIFPREAEGVHTWKDEFLAAERLFPGVRPLDAWVYNTPCSHMPFLTPEDMTVEGLPAIYRERIRIGKEGPGILLKLGPNSIYGKCAQSIGTPKFQSFVWAGNITSSTRAQLLSAFDGLAPEDWWDVLMFATDGIFSRRPLSLPAPRDTGTAACEGPCDCKNPRDPVGHAYGEPHIFSKPLGGWELKTYKKGVFLLRPGIYFPLSPSEDELKDVKARGMSKAVLLDNAAKIEEHFRQHGTAKPFEVRGLERFVGMKSGVLAGTKKTGPVRSAEYGEWVDYPIQASFSPMPKRARVLPKNRLELFPRMAGESAPYDRANISPEAAALKEAEMMFADQPEGDFAEEYR